MHTPVLHFFGIIQNLNHEDPDDDEFTRTDLKGHPTICKSKVNKG
jgi:hypothetical protein